MKKMIGAIVIGALAIAVAVGSVSNNAEPVAKAEAYSIEQLVALNANQPVNLTGGRDGKYDSTDVNVANSLSDMVVTTGGGGGGTDPGDPPTPPPGTGTPPGQMGVCGIPSWKPPRVYSCGNMMYKTKDIRGNFTPCRQCP